MKRYGYIRVSTKEQNPERQLLALQAHNVSPQNIYLDKLSGKDFARPQYQRLMAKIQTGDVLIIKSIDRLGRNYKEILEQWRFITKKKGVQIEVIDMPLLNTNIAHGDLTGVFISDLVLQILAYVAETERNFIRQRQAEGIAVAKMNGVKFGCPKVTLPDEFEKYYVLWEQRKITVRKAASELGLSPSTFYRRCCERLETKNSCKL